MSTHSRNYSSTKRIIYATFFARLTTYISKQMRPNLLTTLTGRIRSKNECDNFQVHSGRINSPHHIGLRSAGKFPHHSRASPQGSQTQTFPGANLVRFGHIWQCLSALYFLYFLTSKTLCKVSLYIVWTCYSHLVKLLPANYHYLCKKVSSSFFFLHSVSLCYPLSKAFSRKKPLFLF